MGSSKKKSARTRHILDNKRCVFISRISYAIWREDLGLAQLFQRKGKTWHNMGLQVKAEFFCNLIEAAFMSERCNLIVSRGGELLSVKDHFSLLMLREITWQSYFSYVYLKRAGYSLHGNPSSWLKENVDELSRPECTEAEKTATLSEGALLKGNLDLARDCTSSPAKRRKTSGGKSVVPDTVLGENNQGNSREWWQPLNASRSAWIADLESTPKLPSRAFDPAVLGFRTEAFPNLWSFGKKSTFSMSLDEGSSRSFEVNLISGTTPGRKKKSDFSLYIPNHEEKGLTWKSAHHVADLSKRNSNRPAKFSFIDGASVCYFSLSSFDSH